MIHPDGIIIIVHYYLITTNDSRSGYGPEECISIYAVHGVQSDVDNATSFFFRT